MTDTQLSTLAAVSWVHCSICNGTGFRTDRKICSCTLKSVFDECHKAYKSFSASIGTSITSLRWDALPGARGKGYRGSKQLRQIEWCSDFQNAPHKLLSASDYAIFKLHFCIGLRQNECLRRLGLIEHEFWYRVYYHIKPTCGMLFATLKPYQLWPLDEALNGSTRQVDCKAFPARKDTPRYIPLRPPLSQPKPEAESASVVMMPVPKAQQLCPFDSLNQTSLLAYIRSEFSHGVSLRTLAVRLNDWQVPIPVASRDSRLIKSTLVPDRWSEARVRLAMISGPNALRRKGTSWKRKAA